jgi:hypothetical protein
MLFIAKTHNFKTAPLDEATVRGLHFKNPPHPPRLGRSQNSNIAGQTADLSP